MKNALSFIKELEQNNNRDWFNTHKNRYQEALEIFRGFAGELLTGISQFDPLLGNLVPKDTIFRIYKDVRFSKDKLPYKTHFGCWMTKGGRKSTDAGYYFHLEPGESFMAAGVWMPPREQLNLIRQEIRFNPEPYLELINTPAMKERYERGGKEDMLKKGPAGFPKEFIHMEEVKYKHYIWSRYYSDDTILKSNFVHSVAEDFKGLYPLVSYLNHAMSFTGNH
ncbi:MAG: DUF2461 domain-containing protein [Bacteroidales bacterium]|nr:DUF2461 domain-containing protein [Bacteroidales bacterium]